MTETSREIAIKYHDYIKKYDSDDVRALIVDTMIGFGDYDVWTDVFSDDEDMLNRFKANKHKIIPREPLFVDYING